MRTGPVITTFTGRTVNPLALEVSDIDVRDIAHALACQNRFAGHTQLPVNTALHSYYVSMMCPSNPLRGLLHDGAEAYLGDVTK